ncbi:MAG: MBL fold metallo-hydrolase [Rhodanobacteraceae bacterium]
MNWQLHFLGTGDSRAMLELGSSAAVLECDSEPRLLIDCGPDIVDRYLDSYGTPPPALYITHTHMDHVGGLERLFSVLQFDPRWRGKTRVFAHAALVPLMQARIADYPNVAAEGGANFWQAFHLVPCTRGFWLDGLWLRVFATRHHAPGTSFGLVLPGSLVYSGDTRPIPEALKSQASQGELIAHDCALEGNPSHTGLDDLQREYPEDLRQRMILYHYASAADGREMSAQGFRVAEPGQRVALASPAAVDEEAG